MRKHEIRVRRDLDELRAIGRPVDSAFYVAVAERHLDLDWLDELLDDEEVDEIAGARAQIRQLGGDRSAALRVITDMMATIRRRLLENDFPAASGRLIVNFCSREIRRIERQLRR